MSKEEATAIRIFKLLAKYKRIGCTDDLGGHGPKLVALVYLAIAGIDLAEHLEHGHRWESIRGGALASNLASNAGVDLRMNVLDALGGHAELLLLEVN